MQIEIPTPNDDAKAAMLKVADALVDVRGNMEVLQPLYARAEAAFRTGDYLSGAVLIEEANAIAARGTKISHVVNAHLQMIPVVDRSLYDAVDEEMDHAKFIKQALAKSVDVLRADLATHEARCEEEWCQFSKWAREAIAIHEASPEHAH